MGQQEVIAHNVYEGFEEHAKKRGLKRFLLICGKRVRCTGIGQYFVNNPRVAYVFSEFEPNPSRESVDRAAECFAKAQCDAIFAIGGGSAIDVGKCVKAFLKQDIPYFVIPTTAGTGSEATRFAVIYENGEKKSVEDEMLIPNIVFMESSLLATLPLFQKKATMLDALCHCVESYWAKGATEESREYAKMGLSRILENYALYLQGDETAAENMLFASNDAGKAINISKTTAGHALSYKLTKLYNIPHGLAAAIVLAQVWEYTWFIAQSQENERLVETLAALARIWGCESVPESVSRYRKMLDSLNIVPIIRYSAGDMDILVRSVNRERLGNHPTEFSVKQIEDIYRRILKGAAEYEG